MRRDLGTVHARITPTWDNGAVMTVGTGRTVEYFPSGAAHEVEPGKHHWIVVTTYCIDVDRYDPSVERGGNLGVLGPDKVYMVTPVICSECAAEFTPEERNTRCSGEVPE